MNGSPPVRVRAAPAPSGSLHVGNVRTFLYNWLHARHSGGKFVLRIEDTDTSRFTEQAYVEVLEDLRWLGLDWDEGPQVEGPHAPYRQSQRTDLHKQAAERLLAAGNAYRCYCTKEELDERRKQAMAERRRPGYDGRCSRLTPEEVAAFEAEGRSSVVRVRVPDKGEIVFEDLVIGPVTTNLDQIDDFAILRSDGAPLYHLAVVVDDGLMEISDVIRGDDLLSNTPKQILLHTALGNPIPKFGHLPQVLGPDRKPLGKRHGSVSVRDFREAGYLPEAMVNFLALLGWGTADDTILSREELIARFQVSDVHASPAMFDTKKLDWMNGEYLRLLPEDELTRLVTPFYVKAGLVGEQLSDDERKKIDAATPLIQTRIRRLEEAPGLVRGLFGSPEIDPEAARKAMSGAHVTELFERTIKELATLEPWDKDNVEATLRAVADDMGLKPRTAFAPFYVAISGSTVSAPVFDLMTLLGRHDCLVRLQRGLEVARNLR
ncbi:MAG TPA: glutamate--tRNA ligase [Actinomycetota bacterium]|nr:glutamate--tRNA ligase [Actinomycetota bacterium]